MIPRAHAFLFSLVERIGRLRLRYFFLLLTALSIVLTSAIYWPARNVGYLSDDWGYVYLGEHAKDWCRHPLRPHEVCRATAFFTSPDPYGSGRGNFRPLPSTLSTVLLRNTDNRARLMHILAILLQGVIAAKVGILSWLLFHKRSGAIFSDLEFASSH